MTSATKGRADQLIRNADLAMYQTKSSDKAGYTTYEKNLHGQIFKTLQREVDLRFALENDQFLLEFQPIICLRIGKLYGFEALIRWLGTSIEACQVAFLVNKRDF